MYGKIWLKLHKKHKIVAHTTVEAYHKDVQVALSEAYKQLDISSPIWSTKNIKQWEDHAQTRFFPDDFVDDFNYDNLELVFIPEENTFS